MTLVPRASREAFQHEMIGLLPRLRRFAHGLARNSELGDDLVQSAVLRAIDRAGQFDSGTRMDRLLFRIIHTLWLDEMRKRVVRTNHLRLASTEHDQRPGEFPSVESEAEAGEILDALDELPMENRSALLLVAIEGYTYAEAAQILEISAGTVASRIARAREQLHTILNEGRRPRKRGESLREGTP